MEPTRGGDLTLSLDIDHTTGVAPALIEFLQCDLVRADPFLKKLLTAHPCG